MPSLFRERNKLLEWWLNDLKPQGYGYDNCYESQNENTGGYFVGSAGIGVFTATNTDISPKRRPGYYLCPGYLAHTARKLPGLPS